MKSKYALIGVVLVAAIFGGVAYRLWFSHVGIILGPPPCFVDNIFLNAVPDTLCRDHGCVGNFNPPNLIDPVTGKYACCPVGFELKNKDNKGIWTCEKRRN